MVGVFELVTNRDVERLDATDLRYALREARRLEHRLQAFILRLAHRADRLATEGRSAPAEEFLLGDGRIGAPSARREASRCRTIVGLRGLHRAMEQGNVGPDHLDSIARRLRRLSTDQRQALNVEQLVNDATSMPADAFDKSLKRRIEAVMSTDQAQDETESERRESSFRHWFDERTGMGCFAGRLDPERYEAMAGAVEQSVASLANEADRTITKDASLAAEALVELVCSARGRGRNLPHIVVVTDHETLQHGHHDRSICETSDGHALTAQALSRLACDATIRRVTADDDRPLGTGRSFRTATSAQWDAVRSLYSSCSWAGCDRPLSWCQIHHILEWRRGGEGEMDNFVPLCSRHHHAVHDGRWSVELLPDRSLRIWRPDGHYHRTTDPPGRRHNPIAT